MKKSLLLLFFTLFSSSLLFAQAAYELNVQQGRLLQINPIFPEIKGYSTTVMASWFRYTNGQKFRWASRYRQPMLGVSFSYQSLGNKEVLGSTIGVVPSINFNLFKTKIVDMQLGLGLGLAYATKKFHKINNPKNNVIGANLNAYGLINLMTVWHLSSHFKLTAGGVMSHYSNGDFEAPNLGANTPSGILGLRYIPHPTLPDTEMPLIPALHPFDKKIRPYARFSLGVTERSLDGPKYPVYVVSAGIAKSFSPISRASIGAEYIFNQAPYEFMKHIGANEGEEFKQASRYVVHLGHELNFGHIGFLTEGGFYLNNHYGRRSIISTKIGFNFYPKNAFRYFRNQIFMGVYVRSYFGEAEFVEFALGYKF